MACAARFGRSTVRLGEHSWAGESEQRRHQRDRDDDRDRDHQRCGVAERSDERYACQLESEDRDDDGASGDDDGLAGGGVGAPDRLVVRHAGVEVVAVSAQDEQRVVDTDPESDHRAQPRGNRGDLDQCAHETDQRQPDNEADDRHAERQDRRVDAAKRDEQDDQGGDDADHLGWAGGAFLQHRRQLTAVFDLDPCRIGRRTRFRAGRRRTSRPRSAVEPSNCTEANAVRPSCDIDRGLASGSVTAITWSSARTSAMVPAIPAAESGSVTEPSVVWNTTIAVAPERSGNSAFNTSTASCDSTPGTSKLSTVPAPLVRSTTTTNNASRIQAATTQRRWRALQATETVEPVRHVPVPSSGDPREGIDARLSQ